MPTPKQRLDIVLEYTGMNLEELSKKLGYDKETLSAIYNGLTDNFPPQLAQLLNQEYKFNTKWLLDNVDVFAKKQHEDINKDIFDNQN